MKIHLLFTCGLLMCFANAQQTYIPDDNFEQRLIDLGYDSGALNDSVLTETIDTLINLFIGQIQIEDLTGIEDFVSLEVLHCPNNPITHVDLSNNIMLKHINFNLCELTSLNVSNHSYLEFLGISQNELSTLDLSNNPALTYIRCEQNNLTELNLANTNNVILTGIKAFLNPNLVCVQVDDTTYSNSNWTLANGFNFTPTVQFSENCNPPIGIRTDYFNAINLYPNPTTHLLNIELKTKGSYQLCSTLGKTVFQLGNLQKGKNSLDLSALNNGIYTLKIRLENNTIITKKVAKFE